MATKKKLGARKYIFRERDCQHCLTSYIPTNGRQKYCSACIPIKNQEFENKWVETNKQKLLSYHVDYNSKHSLRIVTRKANTKYRKAYGLSLDDVYRIWEQIDGKCECCSTPIKPPLDKSGSKISRVHVDHDHKTGKYRGLLCMQCNSALGLLKDRPDLAVKYLETRKQ